jgi:hypothetical protein
VKRPRWHLHFTPTSASWLTLVKGWFALLTRQRLEFPRFCGRLGGWDFGLDPAPFSQSIGER